MADDDAPKRRGASSMMFSISPHDIDNVKLTAAERLTFRQRTAKREAPWIAASVAAVSFTIATLNSLVGTGSTFQDNLPIFFAALLLLIAAPLIGRTWMPAAAVPWINAGLAFIVVLSLLMQERANFSDTGMLYALFAIAAFGPIVLDWRAAIAVAVPMFLGCVWVASSLDSPANVDWVVASIAALLISGVLLNVRLRGVDDLAKALALQAAFATEDPLTGMLNRRGLDARTSQVFSLAARGHVTISAMFVDVDGLKQVNDHHGHHMGDLVIKATAEAIRESVRAGDLTCRWGGDEFLILAIGTRWNPELLTERIRAHLAQAKVPATQWRGSVTFGWASVDPGEEPFDELVRRADADMYSKRAHRNA